MITNVTQGTNMWGRDCCTCTYYGLSSDTKPTNATNGDVFFEMDTSSLYMYNESAQTWVEL